MRQLPSKVARAGVDIDEPAIQRAREANPSGNYVLGDLEDFALATPPDLFTMFHVLEHLQDPVALLRNLWHQSHEETRLVLEVPILELVDTEDVCGFFSVQHLTHFTRATLRPTVRSSGWDVEKWIEHEIYNGCRVLCSRSRSGPRRTEAVTPIEDKERLYLVLADWYGHSSRHATTLAQLRNAEHVVIWGAGMHTETLQARYALLSALGVRMWSIVDSDALKQGKTWRGIRILSPAEIGSFDWERTKLLISTYRGQEDVAEVAISSGVPTEV